MGHEKSDRTERLHFHFSLSCIGEGNGNPLQCSCLENPRDGVAWWAAIFGVTQSRTRLKQLSSSSSSSHGNKDGNVIWAKRNKLQSYFTLKVKVAHQCPTLCDPMGYTVHGILQARILEWVAIPFSKGSSRPRNRTRASRIAGEFFSSGKEPLQYSGLENSMDCIVHGFTKSQTWLSNLLHFNVTLYCWVTLPKALGMVLYFDIRKVEFKMMLGLGLIGDIVCHSA